MIHTARILDRSDYGAQNCNYSPIVLFSPSYLHLRSFRNFLPFQYQRIVIKNKMRMHMQDFMFLKVLCILIFIQQMIISSYHTSNNWILTNPVYGYWQLLQGIHTKSQNCPPWHQCHKVSHVSKIFVLPLITVGHQWTYINIFELVRVYSFSTSGLTSSICLFSIQLSFCLWLKVLLKFQTFSSILSLWMSLYSV